MKVTSKGQITIPLPIRTEFGFAPGTEVEFVARDGQVILQSRRPRADPIETWLSDAVGVARGRISTAEIMKLTRGED